MRAPHDRPNVILIQLEDFGYGDLGCYGNTVHHTPHIDSLARDGMRFTDYNSTAPVCTPARAAILTGCLPPRVGMHLADNNAWVCFPADGTGLNPDELTIAGSLKEADYVTHMVGKWHCGDQPEFLPTRHGFDHYFGIPYSNDMGRQPGREGRPPLPLLEDETVLQAQPDQAALTERYTAECVRFIRQHRDEPFFLYFAHMHMHLPLYAPQRFHDASQNGDYGACLGAVDWSTGWILHELKQLGLDEHTIVIFTADHGAKADVGGSNAPLRGSKGNTYEGGCRLAFLLRWTGTVPAGSACHELTTGPDVLPTLATICGGAKPQARIDGHDVRDLWFGKPNATSPHASLPYYLRDELQAIRAGQWKLHLHPDRRALYHLGSDLGEQADVAAEHPDIVAQLNQIADQWRGDLGDGLTSHHGAGRRPAGHVAPPKPLTDFDEAYPYIEPVYANPSAG